MSTQPFDYAAIVADLEAKKAAIEATLASLRSAMALGALGVGVSDSLSPQDSVTYALRASGEVPAGAFLGKSIPDASKLYLEIVKKKQTSKEIAEALLKGGMESTSKKFPAIVHAVLDRARKAPNSALVKIGSQWGLAAWYPKGIVSAAATQNGKKGKKKPSRRSAANAVVKSHVADVPKQQAMLPAAPAGNANDRALEFLRNSHGEHSAEEVGKHIGMGERGARLILGKLVKANKIRLSAPGMYTCVPFLAGSSTSVA